MAVIAVVFVKAPDGDSLLTELDEMKGEPAAQIEQKSNETAIPATGTTTQTGVKEFTVTGSNFKFEPSQMTVNKGDTVKITFQNSGGKHDFVIDEFNVETEDINGGENTAVTFVADKTGSFEYYCSVGNHRQMGMKGTLTVQ